MRLGEEASWVLPSPSVPGCVPVDPSHLQVPLEPFPDNTVLTNNILLGSMQCWALGEVMSAALGLWGSLWVLCVPQLFQEPSVCILG